MTPPDDTLPPVPGTTPISPAAGQLRAHTARDRHFVAKRLGAAHGMCTATASDYGAQSCRTVASEIAGSAGIASSDDTTFDRGASPTYRRMMASRTRPTGEDRASAIRIALSGAARGDDPANIADRLAPLHPPNNTFPAEVLLELAADAIDLAGASRDAPIEFEGIRERYLPEAAAHTRAQHHKSKYALRAAAMLRGGVDPGLLDEVGWWRTDDVWFWSLEAVLVYVRVAADRTGESIDVVCRRLAERLLVRLDDDVT